MRVRQGGDRHGGARRALVAEELAVHLVVSVEVVHADEKRAHLDHVGETGAGGGENVADVLDDAARLRADIELRRAVLARLGTGDRVVGAPRAGARYENEVPGAAKVRETAAWPRLAGKHTAVGAIHSFTQMFIGSEKKPSECMPPSRPIPESFAPPNGVRRSRRYQSFTQVMPTSICRATRWARCRFEV